MPPFPFQFRWISLLLPCKEFEFQSEIGIHVGCLTWSHYAILVSNGARFLSSHRKHIFIELFKRHPLLVLFQVLLLVLGRNLSLACLLTVNVNRICHSRIIRNVFKNSAPAHTGVTTGVARIASDDWAEGFEPVKAIFKRRWCDCEGDPEPILVSHSTSWS